MTSIVFARVIGPFALVASEHAWSSKEQGEGDSRSKAGSFEESGLGYPCIKNLYPAPSFLHRPTALCCQQSPGSLIMKLFYWACEI